MFKTHIAIICSDKDAALHFYHDILGFPIIRSNFRQGRQDWKIDLRINETTGLELFIMSDRPARVTNPEAYGLRHLAFQVSSVSDTVAELEKRICYCLEGHSVKTSFTSAAGPPAKEAYSKQASERRRL